MYKDLFNEFSLSDDTLRVYKDNDLLFASGEHMLKPLLEYIERFAPYYRQVVIFDKVIGNAAALLAVKASCQEVRSLRGSQLAIGTLDRYGIRYYFAEVVPCIQRPGTEEMCPMEKLSIDKEPEEFYRVIKGSSGYKDKRG